MKVIYNYDSLYEEDVNNVVKRAKAIINSKGKIAICYSHNNYFLLGGHVEDETDAECLKREIKEEAGIDLNINVGEPFLSIIYYNKNYPEEGVNTKSIANYYVINEDFNIDKNNINLTEDEKEGNFEIRFFDKENILDVLNNSLASSTRKAVVRDTINALETYLRNTTIDMKLQTKPFELIKNKNKNIEMRLYDEKRQKIKIGDKIVFTNIETNEKIEVMVIGLHIFSSFEELYKHFDKEELGYFKNEVADFRDMQKYYSKEDEEKYGVVGIEVKY